MKRIKPLLLAATLAATLAVGAGTINPEPAAAHTVTGCAVRAVTGSYNYTWASDTYSNHSSPANCDIQARLARNRYGSRYYLYGSTGIIRSYIYSNSYGIWYGSARNCARIKVPSTGYVGPMVCIN